MAFNITFKRKEENSEKTKKKSIILIICLILLLGGLGTYFYVASKITPEKLLKQHFNDTTTLASTQIANIKIEFDKTVLKLSLTGTKDADTTYMTVNYNQPQMYTEYMYVDTFDSNNSIYRKKKTDVNWSLTIKPVLSFVDDMKTEFVEINNRQEASKIDLNSFKYLTLDKIETEYVVMGYLKYNEAITLLDSSYQAITCSDTYSEFEDYFSNFGNHINVKVSMYFDIDNKLLTKITIKPEDLPNTETQSESDNLSETEKLYKEITEKLHVNFEYTIRNTSYEPIDVFVPIEVDVNASSNILSESKRTIHKYECVNSLNLFSKI